MFQVAIYAAKKVRLKLDLYIDITYFQMRGLIHGGWLGIPAHVAILIKTTGLQQRTRTYLANIRIEGVANQQGLCATADQEFPRKHASFRMLINLRTG